MASTFWGVCRGGRRVLNLGGYPNVIVFVTEKSCSLMAGRFVFRPVQVVFREAGTLYKVSEVQERGRGC